MLLLSNPLFGGFDATGAAVEYADINSLIPYALNSRTHSDEQVAQIAASIREFGFLIPVLTDSNGG